MENMITAVLSIVAVINIILALVIFSRGLKSLPDVLFGLIALTCAVWSIAIIGFYSEQYGVVFNWILLTHSSALLIPFLFLMFALNFPKRLSHSMLITSIASIIVISMNVLIFGGKSIIGSTSQYMYEIGELYLIYSIVLVLLFISGYLFSIFQYNKGDNRIQKMQVLYVLIGSAIASIFALVTDLIFPYFSIFQYTWLGPLFTLVMVVSIFIAMLKYHLFNVKVILTEIVSIVIVVALLLEVISAKTSTEVFLKTLVLLIVTVFSYLLINSVYREVSQRERIEKLAADLQKANDRLTELDKQKSEFISFATHQLRAPLTAMKGYASLILDGDMGTIPSEAREGVNRIFESTNTLVSIVNDYLNVSRIELGAMKYEFETLDMKKLVEDVAAELKPSIEKSKLEFSVKIEDGGSDFRIHADKDKLKQVIVNLIDNSVKYTPKGKIEVTLSRGVGKRGIIFTVKDTGIGIAPEVLPKLFGKFTRAQNANKVNIKGTGLGLYVAREMVAAHHGTIHAESEGEGKGSKFVVELPGVG